MGIQVPASSCGATARSSASSLNRPDVRNAFNEDVIAELTWWADSVAADRTRAPGRSSRAPARSFCAGADLDVDGAGWSATRSEENVRRRDARWRGMFLTLDRLPVPVIGRVHGAALGGGAGLAAVCDIVVAADDAVFGFTEVKLGIIPAVISPFVLAKIGRSAARELFLTGARFGAARAREIGLVHAVVPAAELDATVARYRRRAADVGAEARSRAAKALIAEVGRRGPARRRGADAPRRSPRAACRAEGQEGMRAFLEKRTPSLASSSD